ncbi:hypothetical protein MA16_Dca028957 [Dendrobium catenatum]|uniref:Uncharacterized protein n=1 Tax=Dendrobium catenatum TaxID=906689 RepID=A0A2I0VGB5_9ASPA|nr:hypothetical protein MA16_Dca028957 [Dendrobium catenatum]
MGLDQRNTWKGSKLTSRQRAPIVSSNLNVVTSYSKVRDRRRWGQRSKKQEFRRLRSWKRRELGSELMKFGNFSRELECGKEE